MMSCTINPLALLEFEKFLGKDGVVIDKQATALASQNTLGMLRETPAVVFPRSVEQVLRTVAIAQRFQVPLYPISCGKNRGYGDMAPPHDGQVIVNLSKMNAIRACNTEEGYVVIEPGVTQVQLYQYVAKHAPSWMIDVTGASPHSSILGNALDGGFGHTPLGNRRKSMSNLEVVLGNGSLFRTGTFPAMGPDLNGIFVQSNFGIVTAAQIKLMRKPEVFLSFRATTRTDGELEGLIDTIRDLREQGTLTSLVHIIDPLRMLVSIGVPKRHQGAKITASRAAEILSSMYGQKHFWSAVGGLYGTKEEVHARKKVLTKAMRARGTSVTFFSDRKIAFIKSIAALGVTCGDRWLSKNISDAMHGLSEIHALMMGIPSAMPDANIGVATQDDALGLVWVSPTFAATGSQARIVSRVSTELFDAYGFEAPLTITLVEPHRAVGILNVRFNKQYADELARAHTLYRAVKERFASLGIYTYRTSLLDMHNLKVAHPDQWDTYERLKEVLDPHRIIAPGRYGIGIEESELAKIAL
jgi:4-cresol dehydrogenase (hydroxylating)